MGKLNASAYAFIYLLSVPWKAMSPFATKWGHNEKEDTGAVYE